MKYTSSEANKLLRKINADYQSLIIKERESRSFLAATGEDPESVRPDYDYQKVQDELREMARKIRILKHAINVFNTTTIVDGFNMTIDEMLVVLPQLTERVNALDAMRTALPKKRERTFGTGTNATIDYRYINYDLDVVSGDYETVYDLLSKAQTALDLINNTAVMEIEL